MNTRRRFSYYLMAAVAWMALLFVLGSIPWLSSQPLIKNFDKLGHIGGFGILGLLVARCISEYRPKFWFLVILVTVVLVTLFGSLDELHQLSVPGRTGSLLDLRADVVGGFLGAITYLGLKLLGLK